MWLYGYVNAHADVRHFPAADAAADRWFFSARRFSQSVSSKKTLPALYTAEPSYLSELISPYVPARTLRSSNTYLPYLLSIQYQQVLQVNSPHALFLFPHRQPGTLYLNIFAL